MRVYSYHLKMMALLAGGMLVLASPTYAQDHGTVMKGNGQNQVHTQKTIQPPKSKGTPQMQKRPTASKPSCVWVKRKDGKRVRVCGAAEKKKHFKH